MPLKAPSTQALRTILQRIPGVYACRNIRVGIFRVTREASLKPWDINTVNGRHIGTEMTLEKALCRCWQEDESLQFPRDIQCR